MVLHPRPTDNGDTPQTGNTEGLGKPGERRGESPIIQGPRETIAGKNNRGENVGHAQLLFPQKAGPRPGREAVAGSWLPGCFSVLTIHFLNRHAANSNETLSSEKPFR